MMGCQSWGGGQGAGAIATVEQFLMRGPGVKIKELDQFNPNFTQ